MRSNVRKASSPKHRKIKSSNDVTDYRWESDVIYDFLSINSKETTFPVHWSVQRVINLDFRGYAGLIKEDEDDYDGDETTG